MLHLIGLDRAVLGNNVFEHIPKRRNIPLPIAKFEQQSAFCLFRLRRERPVKGAARGNYAQVSIEYDEGFADSVDDGLRQGVPARNNGQRIVTAHPAILFAR